MKAGPVEVRPSSCAGSLVRIFLRGYVKGCWLFVMMVDDRLMAVGWAGPDVRG
jgi:hypothetical protein